MPTGEYTFAGVCKGTTKVGTPCRRIVVYANGFCKAHGGSSAEYMRQRIQQIKQKAQRRAAKFRRKLAKLLRA